MGGSPHTGCKAGRKAVAVVEPPAATVDSIGDDDPTLRASEDDDTTDSTSSSSSSSSSSSRDSRSKVKKKIHKKQRKAAPKSESSEDDDCDECLKPIKKHAPRFKRLKKHLECGRKRVALDRLCDKQGKKFNKQVVKMRAENTKGYVELLDSMGTKKKGARKTRSIILKLKAKMTDVFSKKTASFNGSVSHVQQS